ncbi:MAG: DNA polymerase Y family protein [Phycisphaerales bacterium]|nr:DNA polymerase Y family protein [Phycisphaerales bacterium]
MRRVLSVYIPDWALRCAKRRQSRPRPRRECERAPGDESAPTLLLRETPRGVFVADCCAIARRVGVRPDIGVEQARAMLSPADIVELPDDPDDDRRRLNALARWSLRYTPLTQTDPPDGLTLDISGCAHLLGGESGLIADLLRRLRQFGIVARVGVGPTPGAAWALARFTRQRAPRLSEEEFEAALNAMPIAALHIDTDTEAALCEVGLDTIAALRAVPRDSLRQRFGAELLWRIDEVFAVHTPRVAALPAPEAPRVEHIFDGPIRHFEIVTHVTRDLAARLLASLGEQRVGVLDLCCRLTRCDDTPLDIALAFSQPTARFDHVWRLLYTRLERAQLGFGVEAITLDARRTQALRDAQPAFWLDVAGAMRERGQQALGEFVDHCRERFGAANVRRFRAIETHVPEHVFQTITAADAHFNTIGEPQGAEPQAGQARPARRRSARKGKTGALASECRAIPNDRPTAMFDPPEPAQVMSVTPDGPPIWLRWRGVECRVRGASRAARVRFPWWNDALKGGGRDYYRVQDQDGRWLWVFHAHRLNTWFVHGEWA